MFKDIPGYEGLYAINEQGQVWSHRRNKIMKPWPDGRGYLKVTLTVNYERETKRVHRLVMQTFCPVEGMENLEVNHLNEVKTDNRLENLAWTTKIENIRYGTGSQRSGLTRSKPVAQYTKDGKLIAKFSGINEAARQLNAQATRISMCCNGKALTHRGYKWRFINE